MYRTLRAPLLAIVPSLTLVACRGEAPRPRTSSTPLLRPAPVPEDERGVIGGPRDDTAFDFEPAEDAANEKELLLDGTGAIPDDLRDRLAPYLDARRTRLVGALPGRSSFLAITRMGRVPQVYAIDLPLGPLRRLTGEHEPIEQVTYFPSPGPALLYRTDQAGDERYQLVRLSLEDGSRSIVSDGESRHGAFSVAPGAARIAFTANGRTEPDMDVYIGDGRNPDESYLALARKGQWIAGSWSNDGTRLLVREYLSTEHSALYILDVATSQLEPVAPTAHPAVYREARFSTDDRRVYFTSDRGGDFVELYELELATGDLRSLTRDLKWDVEGIALWSSQVAFATNEDGQSVLRVYDAERRIMHRVRGVPSGVVSSFRFADRGTLLAMTVSRPNEPDDIYTVDVASGRLERWTTSLAGDPRRFLVPSRIRVSSFDRLTVPAYYYRPRGPGPFPVLLWMHGGPEEQYRPIFDPIIQYFAVERGIAVVAPNIRGSDGYGRHYRSLDNGTLRNDAVRDVGAILDWIESRPELDATRVGIYGASYGGYMVLASMVQFGDRLAAGCDVVGLSNLITFLEGTSAYRRNARRAEYGDERDPVVRAALHALSPLASVDRIQSPLFVAHGANDPRVPLGEAEQIVRAVRQRGLEAWYMVAPDEGHGFRKRRTRDTFYQLMAAFFERHLLAPRPPPPGVVPPSDAGP